MNPVEEEDFNPANSTWDTQSLKQLLYVMEDPEVLKAPLLRSLYCLLVYLFSNSSLHCSNIEALKDLKRESHQFDLKATFADICKLSNFLFKELQRKFEKLSAWLNSSVNMATDRARLCSDILTHPEDLTMLLRCCLITLLLLEFDQSFLLEKCQVLLEELRFPELSLTAAIVLLGTPTVFSAPPIFQVHLISLISRAVGIVRDPEDTRLNPRAKNCYISAFEHSVILYNLHISSLEFGSNHFGGNIKLVDKPCILGGGCQPSFQSNVRPVTYNRINHEIPKSTCSWHSGVHESYSKMTSGIMSVSIAYMTENLYILDKTCRDEIFSILKYIISRILSNEIAFNVLNKDVNGISEKMYLLASILKLMSSSLLQIVWWLKQNGSSGCQKTLEDYPSCREYDFIMGIIGCFQQYSVSQPIQLIFSDARGVYPGRHKESIVMLIHMAGLLLFSFNSGLEFLWKSCIFMMMTIMNLITFEEGNVDGLRSLLGFEKESAQPFVDKSPEVLIEISSSAIVARQFQKIKMTYLRSKALTRYIAGEEVVQSETLENTLVLGDVESQCVLGIEEEDTCNGENFIKLIQGGHPKSDLDDLVDFVECKQGKDYSKWLKDRERFRKWKSEKVATASQQRKKTLRKFLTGK
ncbi:PREDICTED: uncharacterized protein LOC104596352 isoform X3 [Nelumbo nucifera]|uniref:Uncharacterized protein LOC104596352 isoform X3 n=1 Tax=Nelumbo nucifera TaxID=4432 RepID=A0A1U7ZQQ1_NELNU|nr:PREDICTED: uncharacterized protein LOC104596352 isoform X3 [Nelumbo nucifera]